MTAEEIVLIQNQVYTQILLEEFKRQRKAGAIEPADFLIDKYEIDKLTADRLKQMLTEH